MGDSVASPGVVLVVDDNPVSLGALLELLTDEGYEVLTEATGEGAVTRAITEVPDLIVLDVALPDVSGLEVCGRLKEAPATSDVPVIFLTGNAAVEDKVLGFRLGAADYVTKPFRVEELVARVESQLQLRRARQELALSYRRLQEAEKLRDGLVHMLVHDMRSPLMVLRQTMATLGEELAGVVDESLQADVDGADRIASRVLGMASDMLDVSRLEAGRLPVGRRLVHLPDVIEEATLDVAPLWPGRSVEVEVEAGLDAVGDGALLTRVVANLVSNGLKHSPPGSRVRVVLSGDDEAVKVEVHDFGHGVPEDLRASLFEKFGTLRGYQEHRYHSSGLGLAFCRLAVEAHGGRIGLRARADGSTFWFEIPADLPLRSVVKVSATGLPAGRARLTNDTSRGIGS